MVLLIMYLDRFRHFLLNDNDISFKNFTTPCYKGSLFPSNGKNRLTKCEQTRQRELFALTLLAAAGNFRYNLIHGTQC